MEIIIQMNELRAAQCAAAKKDIRYYLNGVLYTENMLVATTGTILLRLKLQEEQPFAADFIISNETIDMLSKLCGAKYANSKLVFDVGHLSITLPTGDHISYAPIQGTFPDYKHVLPTDQTRTQGKVAQFNPELLLQLEKAAQLYHGKSKATYIRVYHRGSKAAPVLNDNDYNQDGYYLGVIMPLRD